MDSPVQYVSFRLVTLDYSSYTVNTVSKTHSNTHVHFRVATQDTHTHAEEVAVNLSSDFPILDCPSSRAARSSGQPLWRPGTKSSDPSVSVRDGQESVLFFLHVFLLGFLVEETPCEHGENMQTPHRKRPGR